MTKDRFRPKQDNKYQHKNLQAPNERADDQISPTAAAHSIDALQRWALATANIAQSGHRANETQMAERVRDRYENEAFSLSLHKDVDLDAEVAHSDHTLQTTASKKRKHSISLTRSLKLGTIYSQDAADPDARQTKQRRSKSPGVSTIDGDDDYAQSSEWSFPIEDGMEITKTVTKMVTKTRTYVKID